MAAKMLSLILGMLTFVCVAYTHPTTSTTTRSSSKCDRMPASSAYHGTCYFQYVKGRGMVREQCPYGTRYNENACDCISVSKRGSPDDDDDDSSRERMLSPVFSLMQNKARIIQSLLRNKQSGALERLLKGRGRGGDTDDDNERNDDRGRGENDRDENDDDDNRGSNRGGLGRSLKSGAKSFIGRILGMVSKGLFSSPIRYAPSRYSYNHRFHPSRIMYPSNGDDLDFDERDDHEADDDHRKWTTPTVGSSTKSGSGFTGSGNNGKFGGRSQEDFGDDYGDIVRILFKDRGLGERGDGGGFGGASTSDDGGVFSGGRGDGDDDRKSRGGDDVDDDIVAKIQKFLDSSKNNGKTYGGGAVTTTMSRDNDVDDKGNDGGYSTGDDGDDDGDRKSSIGTIKYGYTSPYSIKGMLTRVRDFRYEDLLEDIFDDIDDVDDGSGESIGRSSGGKSRSYGGYGGSSYGTDDITDDNGGSSHSTRGYNTASGDGYSTKSQGTDDGATVGFGATNYGGSSASFTTKGYSGDGGESAGEGHGSYGARSHGRVNDDRFDDHDDDDNDDRHVFDDYENIYEKKFDGVLEYVNKISNDLFKDDFDDFYEDLFDEDGYDDCFDDKYDHYFDEDYDKKIDDKYDDMETFFTKRHDDEDDDKNDGDKRGDEGGVSIGGNIGLDDKHDDKGIGRIHDDDNDNDDGIWSGHGKFDIYDNLFNSMKNSGIQDSRLFNFGETLKGGRGSRGRSDDSIFDEFYKDR